MDLSPVSRADAYGPIRPAATRCDPRRLLDRSFDRYARLVQHALAVPVALVSLVETERQWFPGAVGLPEPWATCRETPLSHSFCQHVVAAREPLVVTDAREDPRVAGNLAIEDLGVIAYAGHPISDHTGEVIGSLCAIGHEPREWQPPRAGRAARPRRRLLHRARPARAGAAGRRGGPALARALAPQPGAALAEPGPGRDADHRATSRPR